MPINEHIIVWFNVPMTRERGLVQKAIMPILIIAVVVSATTTIFPINSVARTRKTITTAVTIPSNNYGIQTKTSNCTANQSLPDPACTPGSILTTDASVVCVSGYSSKVRDVSVSTKEKVFKEYGILYARHSNYEVDHLISLELGGSNDISNLWPESHNISDNSLVKDKLENHLHSLVCNGTLALSQAQYEISTNWIPYYIAWQQGTAVPASIPTTNTSTSIVPTTSPTTLTTQLKTDSPAVKKSNSGLCHAKGDVYYARTIYFTSYNSMSACIASGGRASK